MAELTTLARPYARAAFEAALGAGKLQEWSGELSKLAAVVSDDKVAAALSRPSLTDEQQAGILIDLLGGELSPETGNFVRLLAENKRLPLLPEIHELFERHKANQERTVDVEVLSAFPLAAESQDRLAQSLKANLQREVSIRSEVDKSLIGGVVIRAGDLVIDGSVRGKLSKLAEAMNS